MNVESLREALLAEADGEEKRHLADVDHTCELGLARARARAATLTARSRAEGERAAAQETRRRLGAARRRGRELRLAAQRTLVEELHRRSLDAAFAARDDPRYGDLLRRLAIRARAHLGPGAELELDPPGLGGVRARAGQRSVDYTLPTLVERTIRGLGLELEALWR